MTNHKQLYIWASFKMIVHHYILFRQQSQNNLIVYKYYSIDQFVCQFKKPQY